MAGTSPAMTSTVSIHAENASDIAALDLLGQSLDDLGNLLDVRVHSERAAEHFERPLLLAELLHDQAEAGQRAEVARLARQHLADVVEGAAVVLLHEIDGGAPVPRFDIVRLDLDHGVEQLDREVELLGVEGALHARHEEVGGIAAG